VARSRRARVRAGNRTAVRPAAALEPDTRVALEELTALDAELYRFGATLFSDRLRAAAAA
jgi:hypothetical protein